jgi:hypothetical protein
LRDPEGDETGREQMIKPLDIEAEYESYLKKCYPFGVGKIQREEMKRVFYAGIHLLLCQMLTFGSDVDGGERELERILAATKDFAKQVGNTMQRN